MKSIHQLGYSTILFVGHLFHDCNRTFGPGLRQTETNECAKRIPDRAATTSNCTPPPLLISFSTSSFFSSSLCLRLALFSRHLLHSILPVFLSTVIHPLICRRLTVVHLYQPSAFTCQSRVILSQPPGSFEYYITFIRMVIQESF